MKNSILNQISKLVLTDKAITFKGSPLNAESVKVEPISDNGVLINYIRDGLTIQTEKLLYVVSNNIVIPVTTYIGDGYDMPKIKAVYSLKDDVAIRPAKLVLNGGTTPIYNVVNRRTAKFSYKNSNYKEFEYKPLSTILELHPKKCCYKIDNLYRLV